MDQHESRQDLANALQAVVDERHATAESTRRPNPPAPTGQRKLLVVGVVGTMALAWLWLARPAAVFEPSTPAFLSAEQREAIARFALFLERARIERFVADSGRLPATLAEAGEVESGVEFRPQGQDFTLKVRDGAIALQLTNRMNADSFLGDALSRIPKPAPQ